MIIYGCSDHTVVLTARTTNKTNCSTAFNPLFPRLVYQNTTAAETILLTKRLTPIYYAARMWIYKIRSLTFLCRTVTNSPSKSLLSLQQKYEQNTPRHRLHLQDQPYFTVRLNSIYPNSSYDILRCDQDCQPGAAGSLSGDPVRQEQHLRSVQPIGESWLFCC